MLGDHLLDAVERVDEAQPAVVTFQALPFRFLYRFVQAAVVEGSVADRAQEDLFVLLYSLAGAVFQQLVYYSRLGRLLLLHSPRVASGLAHHEGRVLQAQLGLLRPLFLLALQHCLLLIFLLLLLSLQLVTYPALLLSSFRLSFLGRRFLGPLRALFRPGKRLRRISWRHWSHGRHSEWRHRSHWPHRHRHSHRRHRRGSASP